MCEWMLLFQNKWKPPIPRLSRTSVSNPSFSVPFHHTCDLPKHPLGFQWPSKGHLSDSYTQESTILISQQFSIAIVSHCQMKFRCIVVTLRQKRRLVYSTQYCSVLIPIVVLERMSLVEFALCSIKLPLQWIQPHTAIAPGKKRLCASQSGWVGRNT